MASVNFKINSKNYSIDCGEGQEDKIIKITGKIDEKINQLCKMFGNLNNETLLLMTCILNYSENDKLKQKILKYENEITQLQNQLKTSFDEEIIIEELLNLTRKINNLKEQLEAK